MITRSTLSVSSDFRSGRLSLMNTVRWQGFSVGCCHITGLLTCQCWLEFRLQEWV